MATAAQPRRKSGRYDRTIIEGSLGAAVWKIAWPTMLTNIIGGLQTIVDQVLVGHLVGPKGNAAIGDSSQVFIAVIVFISSMFIGMSVLVARFAGADEEEKVDHTVYQAFIASMGLSIVMGIVGYFASPILLDVVKAAPAVKAEALPFLRIMFMFSSGMLLFYMLSGALRSAGDARTPMVLGIAVTILNLVLNIVFIRGLGPIRAYGTAGAAIGTAIAFHVVAIYAMFKLWGNSWVISFRGLHSYKPDWAIIGALFRFGLPAGFQGIAMNIGGILMYRFIGGLEQSVAAQAAFAICYGQLFSLITWTSSGLMGAAATVAGQNLGAHKPDRAAQSVRVTAGFGLSGAALMGALFLIFPRQLLAVFGIGADDFAVVEIGVQLLRVLSLSGLFITVALTYTGGLQGTGDTKSPLYISIVSQIMVPLGICFTVQQFGTLEPLTIWIAILARHFFRCVLSVVRFNQQKWRGIAVDIARA